MQKWIGPCELLTAWELYVPAPGYHLHLVKSVAAWLGLCALLCSPNCTKEYQNAWSGSSCPDAAQASLELYREIWSGSMQCEHGFWISLSALLLVRDLARTTVWHTELVNEMDDCRIKGQCFVWDMISQKSVILLRTLSIGQKLAMKLMGLVMKPFGLKYFGSCPRMLALD